MTTRHALIALALVAVLGAVACSGDQSPTAPKIDYDIDTPLLAAGKLPKVNICHLTDDGSFNVIKSIRTPSTGTPATETSSPFQRKDARA